MALFTRSRRSKPTQEQGEQTRAATSQAVFLATVGVDRTQKAADTNERLACLLAFHQPKASDQLHQAIINAGADKQRAAALPHDAEPLKRYETYLIADALSAPPDWAYWDADDFTTYLWAVLRATVQTATGSVCTKHLGYANQARPTPDTIRAEIARAQKLGDYVRKTIEELELTETNR